MDWHEARTLKDRLAWALRKKEGATQADLARACSTKPPSVSDWLSGKTKSLKSKSARQAALYLNVDQLWLESGIGTPFGISTTTQESQPNPYSSQPSIIEIVQMMGLLISKADPVTKSALPGLLALLVEHPEKSPEIGRKIDSLLKMQ